MKVPIRFGQHFTHSSVINEEKGPFSYIKAFKSSNAEEWLNRNEIETCFLFEAPYDKKIYLENDYSNLKKKKTELRKNTRPDL